MRQLILKFTLLIASALALIYLFDQGSLLFTEQKREELVHLFAPHPPIDNPYQIVAIGNSHAMNGLDFTNYQLPAINLGGAGMKMPYLLASLKQYQKQIADNALIIIDISHIIFSHQPPTKLDNLQTAYYSQLSPFLIPKLNLSFYLQKQLFPFLRSFANLREDYHHQVQERKNAAKTDEESEFAAILAQEDFNQVTTINAYLASSEAELNNLPIPAKLDFVRNDWLNNTTNFNQQYFPANLQTLREILAYCRLNHWRPILITTPIHASLEAALPKNYKAIYIDEQLAKLGEENLPYFDFTKQKALSQQSLFFDDVNHLNAAGARVLSYLLLQELINNDYFDGSIDGYQYSADGVK